MAKNGYSTLDLDPGHFLSSRLVRMISGYFWIVNSICAQGFDQH